MKNESDLIKKAINNTINFIYRDEPKCICEQCPYGYKFDKISQNKCNIQKNIIKKKHLQWEQRLMKWKDRLENES